MQYSSTTKPTRTASTGFTLVEMLVIAPIVMLALGGFIALMVTMVGDVLATRDQSTMTYQSQDTLSTIENDIKLSVQYLTTTGTLYSPQGNNLNATGTTAFTNTTGVNGAAGTTLILHSLATDKKPEDATRQIIYYKNQPYDCGWQQIYNNVFLVKQIYFIKDGSLWRRTAMPIYNTSASVDSETLCAVPWQKDSCSPGQTAARCETNDMKLMDNVTSMNVEYFLTPDSFSDIGAANAAQATTVKVTLNGSKTTAGRTIATSQSTRATRINASVKPPLQETLRFTTQPFSQTVMYNETNVQFTATPSLNRATIQWHQSTNGGTTWTAISGATSNTYTIPSATLGMNGYRYRAIATTPEGSATSNTAVLNVQVWMPLALENGWDAYEPSQATYSTGMYTRTSAGLIMLKGLVAGGTASFDTPIATLPAGFCPAHRLTFYVGSWSSTLGSGFGRVDVLAGTGSQTCEVRFMRGTNTWVALESIQFLSSGSPCSISTNLTLVNGWTNWGGVYAPLSLCRDSTGRINSRGLMKGGTATAGTSIASIPSGYQSTEHRIMPAVDDTGTGSSTFGSIGIYGTPTHAFVARGTVTSYLSANVPYIANNGAVSWNTPSILNGSTNYGAPFATLQYGKTSDGVVMIKGLIKGGTVTNGTVVFNLPSGFRPSTTMLLPGVSYNPASVGDKHARLDVEPNGNVIIRSGGHTNWVSFDSVSFYPDGN